jgi:hypothetical protein
VTTQVVDGKPIGDERVVAVGNHGQGGFEERSRRLLRAPPHVAVGMGAPGRLELRERPLPLARAVVEAGRERAERAVAEGLPGCARARVAGRQHALLARREHERAKPPEAEEVVTVPSHCRVLGQRSGAVVGKRHPRELEMADRVVEAGRAVVDPRPDVENGRVLAVGLGEHERPLPGFGAGGPNICELAKQRPQARRLDRLQRLRRPALHEGGRFRHGGLEPLLHRLLVRRERSQVQANALCSRLDGRRHWSSLSGRRRLLVAWVKKTPFLRPARAQATFPHARAGQSPTHASESSKPVVSAKGVHRHRLT